MVERLNSSNSGHLPANDLDVIGHLPALELPNYSEMYVLKEKGKKWP